MFFFFFCLIFVVFISNNSRLELIFFVTVDLTTINVIFQYSLSMILQTAGTRLEKVYFYLLKACSIMKTCFLFYMRRTFSYHRLFGLLYVIVFLPSRLIDVCAFFFRFIFMRFSNFHCLLDDLQ